MARAVFLTSDGLTDPLGGSQILPYLVGLAQAGHDISVISAEKPQRAARVPEVQAQVKAAGLHWHPVAYRNSPPLLGTFLMLRKQYRLLRQLHRQQPLQLVHARSYLTALLALRFSRRYGAKFLFDMRGFWADERRESGAWSENHWLWARVYRWFKRQEVAFFQQAHGTVSLTHAGKAWIESQPWFSQGHQGPIWVIPCAADFDHFRPQPPEVCHEVRLQHGFGPDDFVLLYLGSLGKQYMLPEMLAFYQALLGHRPDAWFWLLTPEPAAAIMAQAVAQGLPTARIKIGFAARTALPGCISSADAALCFILPSFAKTASSPTKVGEILACGTPLVGNAGYGDMKTILENDVLGTAITAFDPESLSAAAAALIDMDKGLALKRRDTAKRWFDLAEARKIYRSVYQELIR